MTEQANPCLPECQPNQAVRQERFHAPACPNAPKASEVTKADEPRCLPECERNCWNGQDKHAYGCPVAALFYLDLKEPAPAPVSDKGADGKTWEPCDCEDYLALRARLAEVEAENEEMSVDYNTLKAERDALRAEVLDLKRKIEVLESDRGKGCNPSRDPDHNDR